MPSEPITIADPDPSWPDVFAAAKTALEGALGDAVVRLEHVGSTAVADLPAKPIIDIVGLLRWHPLQQTQIEAVERLGYEYRGEYGIPGRDYFRSRSPAIHLHLYSEHDRARWEPYLLFRERLRHDPAARAEYSALKRSLAAGDAATDHRRYTSGKTSFIGRVLETERRDRDLR